MVSQRIDAAVKCAPPGRAPWRPCEQPDAALPCAAVTGEQGARAASGRGALLFADTRLLGVGDAAAHVHEASAVDAAGLPSAVRMGREAGARRDQPADDDVLLKACLLYTSRCV